MNNQNLIPPTQVKIANAIYIRQNIPNYADNPLIEALPRILSTEESMKKLAFYPDYDESMRELPNEERYHILEDIVRFFTPLNIHLDLERRISRVIRTGYIERNPIKNGFWKNNDTRTSKVNEYSISQYGDDDDFHSTSAYGFNIVGISGIGKSLAVERIIRLYPQVIVHSKYNGRKFTYSQIVWLKLDCPFDGSIKGLCINFFQTVDSILGTSYIKNYGKSRTTDEMLPFMALVAANQGIGVLVIDEIQRLSLARSGGVEKMLNFFVQMVNMVGVPIILVGTYKSLSIFEGNFSQMRRGTGQGDLVWDRMSMNKEWELFVKALWYFQYTKKVCLLEENPKLIEILYEETQGITDLAVKAYMLAQERAIETGKEELTASIIRSVCLDKFRIIRPALEALKAKSKNALARFEDAYPQFLEKHFEKSQKVSKSNNSLKTLQIEGEIANDPVIKAKIKEEEEKSDNSANTDPTLELIDKKETSLVNVEVWLKKKEENKFPLSEIKKPVLPEILNTLDEINNKTIHEALKKENFIRSSSEFISEGGI